MDNKQYGTLLGLAVGDALGAAVEFKAPGTFEPVTGYRDGGPHNLNAGEWTDDTSLALALAHSIANGWDMNDQVDRYVDWWRNGAYSVNGKCFDIGNTTIRALDNFERLGNAQISGDSSPNACGNGSVMRLAPIPILYDHEGIDNNNLARLAALSSMTTHGNLKCTSGCAFLATLLRGLINGCTREEVLDPNLEPMKKAQETIPFHPEILKVANGSYKNKAKEEIKGSGYVVDTLEAALWAFYDAENFREAVLRVVNLGDDADTTGAVCGQLAGAC